MIIFEIVACTIACVSFLIWIILTIIQHRHENKQRRWERYLHENMPPLQQMLRDLHIDDYNHVWVYTAIRARGNPIPRWPPQTGPRRQQKVNWQQEGF